MPSPYNYIHIYNEGFPSYSFSTDQNINYTVSFIVSNILTSLSGEEIDNVYSVSIDRQPFIGKIKGDNKVKDTILNIFEDFFSNPQNVVHYTCDISDNQELCRSRKFKGWFLNYSGKDMFEKQDLDPLLTGGYFASIIYSKHNSNIDIINRALEEVPNMFGIDKVA